MVRDLFFLRGCEDIDFAEEGVARAKTFGHGRFVGSKEPQERVMAIGIEITHTLILQQPISFAAFFEEISRHPCLRTFPAMAGH